MKNFKTKKEGLEFMIKNPMVKGIIFSTAKSHINTRIQLCLKILHDLKEQAKGISYHHGYIELFNDSIMYFRAGKFPDTYCHMEFDFIAGKIPASVLKFRPDINKRETILRYYKITPLETDKYILWDFKICKTIKELLQTLNQFYINDIVKIEIIPGALKTEEL